MEPVTTFAVIIGIYLLPGLLAMMRDHNNTIAIFVFTIVFGWTGIGWLAAFVWAFTNNRKQL